MSTVIKNLLGLTIAVVLVFGVIAVWRYTSAYARSSEPSSFRSFTVQGEAKVVAKPDVATFSFGIITQGGTNVGALQKENSKKAEQAVVFVKSKGVADKDIETSQYSVRPEYQHFNCENNVCPPPKIVGYRVEQQVAVKVRKFDTISELLGGVVERGANNVSQLQFVIDDPEALRTQARVEAIKRARAKAEILADAADVDVGRLLAIDDGFVPPPMPVEPYARTMMMAQEKAADAALPPIEPGSTEVRATVTLRYEIEE